MDLQEKKKTEIESKAPGINVLATTVAMIAIQNEILDVNNLVKKKTDYNAKILDIESKYITTVDWNKYTEDIAANKIIGEGLVDKFAFARSYFFFNK